MKLVPALVAALALIVADVSAAAGQGSGGPDPPRPLVIPTGATRPMSELPAHPDTLRPEAFAAFKPDKMGKATIFRSDRVLVGLNCFEAGQEHRLHTHAGQDKIYHVLSGSGFFVLDDGEVAMTAGDMLVAPEGVAHGIRNPSDERLVVLAVLAPAP